MTNTTDRLSSPGDGASNEGASNPDPTMQKPRGSPKGENMPPAGGESMSPAKTGDASAAPRGTPDDAL